MAIREAKPKPKHTTQSMAIREAKTKPKHYASEFAPGETTSEVDLSGPEGAMVGLEAGVRIGGRMGQVPGD